MNKPTDSDSDKFHGEVVLHSFYCEPCNMNIEQYGGKRICPICGTRATDYEFWESVFQQPFTPKTFGENKVVDGDIENVYISVDAEEDGIIIEEVYLGDEQLIAMEWIEWGDNG